MSTRQGEYAKDILEEFSVLWEKAQPIQEWIGTYTQIYEEQRRVTKQVKIPTIQQYKLEPNNMQVSFTQNLSKIREAGGKRAILILVTG